MRSQSNRFEGKNILFIYYKFPPIKGIGTMRNVKFYQSLKKVARKVFVATTSNRHFLPQDYFTYDEEDVIEIPTFDFRTAYHLLTGGHGSLIEATDKSPENWIPSLRTQFKKSVFIRYFDEGGSYFVYRGFQKCSNLIEQEKIDIIVSSFLPYDAHRLAYQLKKKFPDIYWIADYRDFFSDPMLRSNPDFRDRKNQHAKLISKADEITTVSQGLKKRLVPFHPQVHVVRNGIAEPLQHSNPVIKYKLFTLSYTGSIYPKAQDGSLLAEALQDLVDEEHIEKYHLQFIYAGKDGLYWKRIFEKYKLGDILVQRGVTPHVEALKIQRKSHLNVLLSWASDEISGILTGKLFEYLAAGPPILAIINGDFDPELDELIEKTSRGKLFYRSDLGRKSLKEYILQQYHTWRDHRHQSLSLFTQKKANLKGIITWQDEFDAWAAPDSKNILDEPDIVTI